MNKNQENYNKKRTFIYIRVSTREQAEEGYSVGEQEERLKKYCEAMEWEVANVYIDPGYTGGDMNRPALKQMVNAVQKGKADIVLVDKLDRLSRCQFDTLYLIQKVFTANNVAFVSRAEAFDTSTPFGRAMVGILAVFAELERERIKERMADGKAGRAKEGKYKGGGNPSIGYDYDPVSGSLVVNEYEAMMIRELYDLVIDRTPMNTIAKIFNEKGYRTKYGAWNDTTVRYACINKVYIGKIQHKGVWYEGLHEAIIPEDKFEKVQQIMAERSKKNDKYRPGKRYCSPLGGLIWCGHCNTKYHWRLAGTNKDGSRRCYYMCYSRSKSDPKMVVDPLCRSRNYRDHDLEKIIYGEILKLKSDDSYFDDIRDSTNPQEKIDAIRKQVSSIDSKISKLMDLYAEGSFDVGTIKAKIEPLALEKESLEQQIELLEAEKPAVEKEEVMNLVDLFEKTLATGNTYKIHDVIMELIEYIEIDGEDIKIHWNF